MKKHGNCKWTTELIDEFLKETYPWVYLIPGQEYINNATKMWFYCTTPGHGAYQARLLHVNAQGDGYGCQCKKCCHDAQSKLGVHRRKKSTPQERQKAAELYAELQNYNEVGRILGRNHATIMQWLCPKFQAKHLANARKKHKKDKLSGHEKKNQTAYRQTPHGKAICYANSAIRRGRKTNCLEYVFFDNDWHLVDRKETWRVFKDYLLPADEAEAINALKTDANKMSEDGTKRHIDHIQPLAKGGEHRLYNLQILKDWENLIKSAYFGKEQAYILGQRLFFCDEYTTAI